MRAVQSQATEKTHLANARIANTARNGLRSGSASSHSVAIGIARQLTEVSYASDQLAAVPTVYRMNRVGHDFGPVLRSDDAYCLRRFCFRHRHHVRCTSYHPRANGTFVSSSCFLVYACGGSGLLSSLACSHSPHEARSHLCAHGSLNGE